MAWMFWLVYAVNVVFLQRNGVSISQVTILDVIWAIAVFVMEVPTGALSDRWSRKYMLVLSSLFASTGFLIFSVTGDFLPFIIATIFMALRFSFWSGTANALLYDTLKEVNNESNFEKILGRSKLLGLISVSIAGVLGSFLTVNSIRLPFTLSIFSSGLAAVIALSFKEPKIHTSTEEVKFIEHLRRSVKFIVTSPLIRFIFLYLVLMDIAASYLDEYDQLYLTAIDFPLAFFGIWIASRRLLGGLGGFFAEKFKERPSGHIKSIALFAMIGALVLIVFGSQYVGLAAFLLIFPIWGVAEVLISGEIHAEIASNQRATIESLIVFFGVILDIPARLSFGFISQALGIRMGYLFVMLALVVYLPYFLSTRSVLKKKLRQS
jgi:MFS family permease